MKLAVLVSHPIQYHTPLYRKIVEDARIDLMVYYCIDYGSTEKIDPGFGVAFKWDTPLLKGYRYKFLKNYSWAPTPNTFFGVINPGILSEIIKGEYDAVLVHGYSLCSNWLGFLAAWISRTPLLFRGETVLRPDRPMWLRALKYILLRPLFWGTAACLTIGSRSEAFYLHYGVPKNRLFFTPYAVDNDYFIAQCAHYSLGRDELKEELEIPKHLHVILFVGKLIERKRPFDLLRVFQRLPSQKFALVFVGDGALRISLESYVKEHRLENVFFLGFKNQTELPKYYALGDVFVLPSAWEVSPLVINEAMCAALPIVVSDAVPSASDFVAHNENGYTYPVENEEKLREYLLALFDTKGRHEKMGAYSLARIQKWNYHTCVQGIYDAMKLVMRR